MTREEILQGIRSWLKAAGAATPLTNTQVIPSEDPGPRPPLPYLTVRVLAHDIPVGEDEDLVTTAASQPPFVDGTPLFTQRGHRVGTVSVQAFGVDAAAWLERATLMLRHPSVLAILDAAAFSVDPVGGLTDISEMIDTEIEHRFARDFEVGYALRSDPEALVELDIVRTEYTGESESVAGDLVITFDAE